MRKIILPVLMQFFLASVVFALSTDDNLKLPGQKTNWHLSLTPHIGITQGHLEEYVFKKTPGDDYRKLSYLEWEENPIFVCGFNIKGGYKGSFISLKFDYGFAPDKCGTMTDSDWLNDYDYDMQTTISFNENSLLDYYDFSVTAGYEFNLTDWLSLTPFGEFSFFYRKFSANNGYGWYGNNVPWDDPSAKKYEKGELCGIDYSRMSLSPYVGGTIRFTLPPRFSISCSAAIAPYTYDESYDTHYKTLKKNVSTQYLDIVGAWFSSAKFSLALHYSITPAIDIGITTNGLVHWMNQGLVATKNSYDKYIENKETKSGTAAYEFNMRLSVTYHFFGRRI